RAVHVYWKYVDTRGRDVVCAVDSAPVMQKAENHALLSITRALCLDSRPTCQENHMQWSRNTQRVREMGVPRLECWAGARVERQAPVAANAPVNKRAARGRRERVAMAA
ncbi:unnamed protein product, partial [Rhizoctonia solani]